MDICFYVDSQAAIASLAMVDTESKLVFQTQQLLNGAARLCKKLTIRWVKAHATSAGNHRADALANEGRALPTVAKDAPGSSWATVRSTMSKKVDAYWNWAWSQEPTCRQTKQWLPKVDYHKSHKIMQLKKAQWGKLCQFITGHNSLNRHLVLTGVDPEKDAKCSLCEEEEMTSAHIMGACPKLWVQRYQSTGSFFLDPPFDIAIGKVLEFMQKCGLKQLQWL